MKESKLLIKAIGFLTPLCIIMTLLTLLYLPKRNCETSESAQVAGFYEEPENTIDVLYLGSCNMYSSVSPLLIYEQYGITGYAMCCPDQEMSTSYYYLKEALKRQDLKAVVLESLFLTNTNGKNRERYNRMAVDYIPLSLNKIELAWDIAKRESPLMKSYDQSAPDMLLTFAGYMFPLLRYHSRTDLDKNDLFLFQEQYNFYKGGFPQYNYTTNDGLYWDKVYNGNEINAVSRKYVPMIKQLCDDNGIELVIIKSPNYARWGYDDSYTKLVRNYSEELGIPFVDFHNVDSVTFEEWDYGYETGRLNIYGVKKLSSTLGSYLLEHCGLKRTILPQEYKKTWDNCVDKYYEVAEEKDCSIEPGHIAQICNRDGAIFVRWNSYEDCLSYDIYRCEGKDGIYQKLANDCREEFYLDKNVQSGQGYSYYVVPAEGMHIGEESKTKYYVYLDMPQNFSVENENGVLHLEWNQVSSAREYRIQRRTSEAFSFTYYDTTEKNDYTNYKVKEGSLYYYRLSAKYSEDGVDYYSATTIARAIP